MKWSRKEYFEITWASLRSMVEPEFAKRSVVSHSEYLPHAKIISSAAVDITDIDVLTKQGSRIAYDYLVVATGHTQSGAWTKTEKISQYQAGVGSILWLLLCFPFIELNSLCVTSFTFILRR